jgi:hypothetical protein
MIEQNAGVSRFPDLKACHISILPELNASGMKAEVKTRPMGQNDHSFQPPEAFSSEAVPQKANIASLS